MLPCLGIPNFYDLRRKAAEKSPLPDSHSLEAGDVAQTAVFLASDAASKITGQTIRVDCGYSIVN